VGRGARAVNSPPLIHTYIHTYKCLVFLLVIAVFFLTFIFIFQIKIPKGIPAGGIRISVSGKNLAYIQNPQMYVYYKDRMFGSVSNYV
jgi:hypothetical protein